MSSLQDYYAMLGIPRDATPEEVRHAYHQSALRLHPDVNVEAGDTELFLDIQHAYDVLIDPQKKTRYDRMLPVEESRSPQIDTNILFSRSTLPFIDEPQLVYALINLSPPHLTENVDSAPLNVCLVLDRSTSMQGERMDTVKNTAIEIIRQLRRQDLISVVAFSDRADVLVPAGRSLDRHAIETRVQMIQTSGATEIFRGLDAGYQEIRSGLSKKFINHIVLITDGRTYGDESNCMQIADQASARGIGISCLGIGQEWNDDFLDALAARTGGSSAYIAKPGDIRRILKEKFLGLSRIYAENVRFSFNLGKDISLRYAFRLGPETSLLENTSPIYLGGIPIDGSLSVVLEFEIPPLPEGITQITLASGQVAAEIPSLANPTEVSRLRITRPIQIGIPDEAPPTALLNAISRLTLYRIQERAHQDILDGDAVMATQHLHNLATHLFAQGEHDLGRAVLDEAHNVEHGRLISAERKKQIKYGTRSLMLPANLSDNSSSDNFGAGAQ